MKNKRVDTIVSYLIITAGSIIMAAGIYFFKFPNNFSTGGVSAMSMILAAVAPVLTAAEYMMIINILLLVVGLLVFGKGFAFKTIYSSMLMSICTRVFEVVIPLEHALTNQKLLELIFAIGLTAVGSALIFNEKASSGGTDIVAMILKKYTNLNIGRALLCTDIILAVASFRVFDIETGMFSVLGLIMKAFVVDNVIDGINLSKCFTIITDKDTEICDYINKELHRGATVSVCSGAFTGENRKMIITVLNRGQAVQLKQFIKETDKHAFTVITNSSDILGKGFRTVV
ncbi:MAG: YitT family protein [Lachnospiraceae bacterium]|nr:YitT family protein [Lachnospiraceae bacterium]